MLLNIGHVLNQVLIVLFPIWFYHLFLREEGYKNKRFKPKLTIVLVLSLLLTLVFSVPYGDHFVYDLKIIPMIIAFLYGSTLSGIIIVVLSVLYKVLFQDGNLLMTIVNFGIATGLLIVTSKKFKEFSLTAKLISISLIEWVITVTRSMWLVQTNNGEEVVTILIYSFISWLTLLSVVFIFENLHKQIELEYKVQRAETINVVGQLAASVAHEVRNPMTAVRGFLQLMRDNKNLNESQKRYINISLEELDHSQSILTEFLSLAKPSTTDLHKINLKDDLDNIIELMRSYTNFQAISIVASVEDDLFIKGDSSEIKQVFVNLMKNSIEAIGKSGKVKVSAYKRNGDVIVEIEDNGQGMSELQLKYLGTPFYSTKDKGTGVGLSVAYKIIHAMKGSIKVDSKLGEGTKFYIQLPTVNE
ncbi:ATP-binding protein [Bacillus suaedaesalsae]|uniref:histidine kinase n=1 Tax=Bacillus suaedaesalsae TaxID=2810349 RepID=A0ABS2DHC4_9BACI|nr:ATP-binding protein [Bacillus suaedaesalsae]MBM6617889.1 GHKL domain-containing protein [Bacillus suaedaesalsae]